MARIHALSTRRTSSPAQLPRSPSYSPKARHPEVVIAALGGAQRLIGGFPDAAVAKVVGVPLVGAHDAAPPELVEAADERLVVELARFGQHRGGELATDRRR